MLANDLMNTPLFSKMQYGNRTASLIQVRDGQGKLYDANIGWISDYIPASDLSLVSTTQAPTGTPASLATAPLYSKAYIDGKMGYIIDKYEVDNQWTGEKFYSALVYFHDIEDGNWYDENQITFAASGSGNGNGEEPPAQVGNNLLKYVLIGGLAYLLFKGDGKKETPPANI